MLMTTSVASLGVLCDTPTFAASSPMFVNTLFVHIRSSIRSFVYTFVRLYVRSSMRAFVYTLPFIARSFVYTFVRPCVQFVHAFVHTFVHTFVYFVRLYVRSSSFVYVRSLHVRLALSMSAGVTFRFTSLSAPPRPSWPGSLRCTPKT